MYLAVDIGATKTLIAEFSAWGRVIRKRKFPTAAVLEDFLGDLMRELEGFVGPRVRAVAVAVPGHVRFSDLGEGGGADGDNFVDFGECANTSAGQIEQKNCSVKFGNRDWGWFDLLTPIKKLFSCPIFVENDANLAAIYESRGLGGKTMFLTFSTGVGGGIAENGRLLSETNDFEPGHMVCHFRETEAEWEDLAAASALEKAYGVETATDLRGEAVMKDVAERMALGLSSLVEQYRPDTMIIGGPMGRIFRRFKRFLPELGVKYRRPKRPLESVIYGCYFFAKQGEQKVKKNGER